jgi:hypothetical protein
MAKQYQVRVTQEFSSISGAASRTRAGISVGAAGDGYVGELSDEQLKEIQDDNYLTVTEVSEETADEAKARIDKQKSADELKAKNEADAKAAAKADADGTKETTDIQAGTPGPVDLSSLNRAQLNEYADSIGVTNTDQYNSKADVIEAIKAKTSGTVE